MDDVLTPTAAIAGLEMALRWFECNWLEPIKFLQLYVDYCTLLSRSSTSARSKQDSPTFLRKLKQGVYLLELNIHIKQEILDIKPDVEVFYMYFIDLNN